MEINWIHYNIEHFFKLNVYSDLCILKLIGFPTIEYYDVINIQSADFLQLKNVNKQEFLIVGMLFDDVDLLLDIVTGKLLIKENFSFEFVNTNYSKFLICFLEYIKLLEDTQGVCSSDLTNILDKFLRDLIKYDSSIGENENSFWKNIVFEYKQFI